MTPRRLKLTLLLASIVLAGLIFLAWTQEWYSIVLTTGQTVSVTGSTAAPATSTLALTTLVLVGALAIAGPVFRVVLGVLEALLGLTIVLSGVLAMGNPVTASKTLITGATGIAGTDSIPELVDSVSSSAWPLVSTVAGALLIVVGIAVAVTGRAWPGSSRKYSAVRTEPVDGDTIAEWDALTSGDDPTDREAR